MRTIRDMLPRVLPAGWRRIDSDPFPAGYETAAGLRILVSIDRMESGDRWLHVSVTRRERMPTWEELREVKNLLIGREKEAAQILPRESEYVDVHRYCLHLWSPVDADILPRFKRTEEVGCS